MRRQPAILGGPPALEHPLQISRPMLPPVNAVARRLATAFEAAILSNNGRFVQEFESRICERLHVRNCVAMCNGTLTLMLGLRALGIRGKVVVPSFTFCATAHAVIWAGLGLIFADIDPETLNITPRTVEAVLTPDVSAIMPVHAFGNPCDIAGLEALARRHGLRLIFDSAQALGSTYAGTPVGSFGDMESFSVHATKVLPTGEGGLITTDDDDLAEHLRCLRNFGLNSEYDCEAPGLNAKMCEFPAIMGIEGLKTLDKALTQRRNLADHYRERLARIPGIGFQRPSDFAAWNAQNFAILVDEDTVGLTRDELSAALKAENVFGREYFSPPVHRMSAYASTDAGRSARLPVTDHVSRRVLCLPLHSDMHIKTVEAVCAAVRRTYEHAPEVRSVLRQSPCTEDLVLTHDLAAA